MAETNNSGSRTSNRDVSDGRTAQSPPPKASAAPKTSKGSSAIVGLCGSLNKIQDELVKKGIYTYPDEYSVEFAPDWLGDAKMTKPGRTNKNLTPGVTSDNASDNLLSSKQSIPKDMRSQPATSGMSIIQFIEQTMRGSSFITDQQNKIIDETTGELKDNGKPAQAFAWFNISASATPTHYDPKRNDFAYKIKYTISPRQTPVKSEWFPQGAYRGVHKVYNYWFTGQNTQVLNFEQHYNTAFHQVINSPNAAMPKPFNSRDQVKKIYQANSGESAQGAAKNANEPGANAADALYNAADWLTIKLKIIGDPAWINFKNFATTGFDASPFFPDGAINFDASPAYFEFAFNTPKDYNLSTGLMDAGSTNAFADRANQQPGVATQAFTFQASKVKHVFKNGQFYQELEGIPYGEDPKADAKVVDSHRQAAVQSQQARAANIERNRTANSTNARATQPDASAPTGSNTEVTTTPSTVQTQTTSVNAEEAAAILARGDELEISNAGGRDYLQSIIDNNATPAGTSTTSQPIANDGNPG